MTFCFEALSQGLGDDQWLARINPPYKERSLHRQLLSSTKISDSTAKKSFGFGVTATKQQRLPTKRFYLDNAAFGANVIKHIQEWNDPDLSSLERLQILQKQVVTAALIVAGDEANPYITVVSNPSITKIDIQDEDNIGAPFWSDILSEELADKIGVPYNRSSHLVAAGTGWSTRTGEVYSREDLIRKVQAVLLHPAEQFGTHQEGVFHVLLLPALICPPVGFFWPTKTTYSEFVTSIKTLNETAYRSFLTVVELCRSTIEPWFDKVNASPKDFCLRMQSAAPLINALPTKGNPIPEGIEDDSLLDPILELLYQLLWPYYEDRVLTDCESKELSTNSASQLHCFLVYGRKCFPESLKSVYGSRIPFLSYFLRPSKGWMMGVDHGALFSDESCKAQWIRSYSPVGVPVIEDDSYEPVMIRTKLELAIEKESEIETKMKAISHSDRNNVAEDIPTSKATKIPSQQNEDKEIVPAVLIHNFCPNDDLTDLSKCFVKRIKKLDGGEKVEVVACNFISKRKDGATVFMEFKDPQHAQLALLLNGLLFGVKIISVQLVQAAATSGGIDMKQHNQHTLSNMAEGGDKYKRNFCSQYTSKNYCIRGDACQYAHGVLELRLYQTTKLYPERCLYFRNVARNYQAAGFMNFIRNKFKQKAYSPPEFTAIHVRGRLGDALVEFTDDTVASVARQLLDGISFVGLHLEIHDWRPEYQQAFVAYFKEERDIPINVTNLYDDSKVVAPSEGASMTNLVDIRELSRRQNRLEQLLDESQKENQKLRKEKRDQDEVLRFLFESLNSMKLGHSTAISRIDSMMQYIINSQEDKLSSNTVSLTSQSHSSHSTDADAGTIQREIERLQNMIIEKSILPDDFGPSSSLPSGAQEIGGHQEQANQFYSSVI